MNLRAIDLNLLVVFDAIYREANVTRAAKRVGLTQPATSNALTRLRGHLKDELFLRSPEGLRPTPRAEELAPRLRSLLKELEDMLEQQEFDPATAKRTIAIAAIDYFSIVILPSGSLPDRFDQTVILDDYYCCLVRKGHPLTKGKIGLRRYANADHLLVSPNGEARGFVDDLLVDAGLTRNIALIANQFAITPPIIASSDLVITAPKRVLDKMATSDHVILDCPVEAPEVFRFIDLVWHDRLSRHPAQIWCRNAIIRAGEECRD